MLGSSSSFILINEVFELTFQIQRLHNDVCILHNAYVMASVCVSIKRQAT